jgi:hypothetical protein
VGREGGDVINWSWWTHWCDKELSMTDYKGIPLTPEEKQTLKDLREQTEEIIRLIDDIEIYRAAPVVHPPEVEEQLLQLKITEARVYQDLPWLLWISVIAILGISALVGYVVYTLTH